MIRESEVGEKPQQFRYLFEVFNLFCAVEGSVGSQIAIKSGEKLRKSSLQTRTREELPTKRTDLNIQPNLCDGLVICFW